MSWLLSIGLAIVVLLVAFAIIWFIIYLEYECDIPMLEILILISIFIICVCIVHEIIF